MMVMAPFAAFLISNYDWRMAYVVIGVIAWVLVIPLARVVRKEPAEIGALPDGVEARPGKRHERGRDTGQEVPASSVLSPLQTMRTRSFWLFVSLWFLLAISMLLITTHIVPHATDLGIAEERAAAILSIIGGASVAGMVLVGIAADRIGRKQVAIICFLGQGVALLWLMWAQELWALYLFAIVFGFANGGIHPATTALIGDTFGLLRIGLVLGLLEIGWAVGAAVGPVMGGYIFDTQGSYFLAFLIGAVAMVVAGFLVLLVRRES
jgi:MFS family permease